MVELEGEDRRIEPRVERMQHRPGHRHAVVRLQHRRRVGQHHGDRVARCRCRAAPAPTRAAGSARRTRHSSCAGRRARPPCAPGNGRRPLQERQRRQRLIVGRALVEVLRVGVGEGLCGHRRARSAGCAARCGPEYSRVDTQQSTGLPKRFRLHRQITTLRMTRSHRSAGDASHGDFLATNKQKILQSKLTSGKLTCDDRVTASAHRSPAGGPAYRVTGGGDDAGRGIAGRKYQLIQRA